MLRRSLARLISLTEAQRLVSAPPPANALPRILSALSEHYRQGGEDFTRAALKCVVQLDCSNDDSQHIADTCLTVSEQAGSAAAAAAAGVDASSAAQPASRHLVTELLRVYPHSPEIRERCCRCLANLCQLSADTQTAGAAAAAAAQPTEKGIVTTATTTTPSTSSSSSSSLADALVEEGAVELILSTLAMAGRLSPRGRCWAAMAMLNITCMSHSGAARATKAGAVDRLAEFILFLLESATGESAAASTSAGPIRGLSEEATIALDAALGALTGVLAAEAPENASGISFNYESASYLAVDAVVRSLLLVSALLVRDGRNDGAYGASLPSRRYGTVSFSSASATQQTAVVVLLPLLHKAWMALQEVCSCPSNLPMVFDVIYEAANANQESMVVANETVVGGSEEVLEVTAQTERQYVAALSSLVDGALFLTTELEGLEEIGADELVRLQRDVRLYVMDAMQSMTASRKDHARASAQTSAGTHGGDGNDDDGSGDATVYPTAAAMSVTEVLASGSVSHMALACAVQLHAEHQDSQQQQPHRSKSGDASPAAAVRPYSTHDFTLLSKALVVLANVAEVGDEVSTSANAVAALQTILVDAVEGIVALPRAYAADLVELFKPTESEEGDKGERAAQGSSSSGNGEAAAATATAPSIHPQDRLGFLQQAALVGQVYAVLWSTLRSAQGVTTVSELRVQETAKEVQASLRDTYMPAIEAARQRYAQRSAGGDGDAKEKGGWVPNTAEETVVRLLKLSDELIDNLAKLSEAKQSPPAAAQ